MGLEDRDWYREEPSKAWKRRWSTSSSDTPARSFSLPGNVTPRPHQSALLAVVLSACIGFATWQLHLYRHISALHLGGSSPSHASPPSASTPTPSSSIPAGARNVVRLHPNPRADIPATTIGRWTIRDPRFGTITVYVPVGETPRQAITVALAARGYQVVR